MKEDTHLETKVDVYISYRNCWKRLKQAYFLKRNNTPLVIYKPADRARQRFLSIQSVEWWPTLSLTTPEILNNNHTGYGRTVKRLEASFSKTGWQAILL